MNEAAGGTNATDGNRLAVPGLIEAERTEPRRVRRAPSAARRVIPSLIVIAACLSAAACTTTSQKAAIDPKYGVAPSPRVVASGEPVPVGGGRYMVGKPYRIAGKWFTPMENPGSYETTGTASWYGSNFHGRRTANGEVFDSHALTAAHPTLPLPSYVRVTNLKNGHSVIVRVNDRGPFHGRRVIDVSRRVAEVLEFKRAGMARLKVQYLGPARLDGKDVKELASSFRVAGESLGPAPGQSIMVPAARELTIASATPATAKPVVRRTAPPSSGNAQTLFMRSGRDSGPIIAQPKPAAASTPAVAPAPEPAAAQSIEIASAPEAVPPAADPIGTLSAAAQPTGTYAGEALPGVTAPALVADAGQASEALAATETIAFAGGMALPRPRPGSVGAAAAAQLALSAAPAAPVATLAAAPAAIPAPEPVAATITVASLGYGAAPLPVPSPRKAQPASIGDLIPAEPPAATGAPVTIAPPMALPPAFAAAPRRTALEAALAKFVAAAGADGGQ